MATATDTYRVLTLDDSFEPGDGQPDADRTFARVRRKLDIEAFGSAAVRARAAPISSVNGRRPARALTGTKSCTSS